MNQGFPNYQYYGLISNERDEKSIIAGLNQYLATLKRTTSKTANRSLLDPYLPFEFKHFYWNLNKSVGIFLAVFPNQDLRGAWVHQQRKDCAWFLQVLHHDTMPGYTPDKAKEFVEQALESMGRERVILEANPKFAG